MLQLPSKVWAIELARKDPYTPVWLPLGCVAAVILGVAAGALLLAVSVALAKHELLLMEILPKHVVRSLEKGEYVAEPFPNAAMLFTGECGGGRGRC